jgi:GMP synthase (glutamine-hydrolysing)
MKIGILQTGMVPEDLSPDFGEYPDMFKTFLDGHNFEFEVFAIVDGNFPNSIRDCDGWLITGSKHGAYEDHDWIPPLEEFIRDIYEASLPMVGICFGHQIMAQALGGKVIKYHGKWGMGTQEYTHPDGTKSRLLAMHQDQVVEKPPEAEIIAGNDFCKMAGLAYKNKALSFQPHPEFTNNFMEGLIKSRAGVTIPNDQAEPALENVHDANDADEYAKIIANFFKSA